MDPEPRTIMEVDLKDGDILTMEGRMQQHCVHIVPKGNPREPIRDERINITFRWVREHRFHCPLHRRQRDQVPAQLQRLFGECRWPHRSRRRRGLPRRPPYVRCWSHEVCPGLLADPDWMELRLCDGCRHVCYEEGRLCCEGRGEWQ